MAVKWQKNNLEIGKGYALDTQIRKCYACSVQKWAMADKPLQETDTGVFRERLFAAKNQKQEATR